MNTCKTCKYFRGGGLKWKWCKHKAVSMFIVFRIPPDFGCIHWTEKGAKHEKV